MDYLQLVAILCSIQVFANAQHWEYYKCSYFLFSNQTANYNDAKSACIGQGGHLAIIPDVETQYFIKTTGSAFKTEGKWMTQNNYNNEALLYTPAYIDAVKTSDGTGWEWSTTGVKFYFKTTQRGIGGPFINYGKYNNWHIYEPGRSNRDNAVIRSIDWRWTSVPSSTVVHYICQVKVKSTKLVVSNMALNVKYGADYVDCNPDLHPGPPVSWMSNSQPIPTNTSARVYQTITKAFLQKNAVARLYLTRGLAQDSGVYTCNASSLDQSVATTVTINRKPRVYATNLTTSSYTCKFIGDSTPSVHWKINDITISKEMPFITTTMLNEHEVSSEISNLLIFGSQDVVSCWASNSYGSSEMTSQSAFPDTPSTAGIVSLGACPGSQLQVNWTDLTKTNGSITYSISVNASGQTLIKSFNQTSTSDNKYSTTLNNLMPRTSYAVKINLFPEYSKKAMQLFIRTVGVKPTITSANIGLGSDNASCLISWIDGKTPGIIGARIIVTTSVYKTAKGLTYGINQTVHEIFNSFYNLPTEPNRKHDITVAAKTCSEVGLAVVVTGQCITPVQAPSYIATPTVEGGSSHIPYLTISKPDESNGPISCYVVIGYKPGSSKIRTSHTWLQIRNITTNNDPSIYCVATLPRFNEARKQVKLSSSDTTQCSLGSSDVIKCTNKPMTMGLIYTFQIVSITSVHGVYLTQTSHTVVTTPQQIAGSNAFTIAFAVVLVALVLVLIAAGYMYRKMRLQLMALPINNLAEPEGYYENLNDARKPK